jgi:hypothetical protein
LNPDRCKAFVFLLHIVQTGSGAHPHSYQKDTRALSRGLSSRGVKLITYLHLVPEPIIVELYLYSPIHLDGIVLN